ncbi:hypothetical protein FRC98_19305 [Lujinxingia vulgaris]|uniref:Endonuclease I n=1 Tax=Lujinxingia vulgaris TaxID=2600176 RepID=A0A5C6X3Q2_9DELT|nr:endonuclease [Lujinxingia vulgaris]TXD34181.1 hypothetical protein FRC98_19305 [Lujinxingia vulgaris]
MRHLSSLGMLTLLIALLGACSDTPDSDVDTGIIDIIDVGDTGDLDTDINLPDADADTDLDAEVPDADTEVPDADTEVPDADTEVPDADTEVPDADTEVPDADANEPDADADEPDADTNEPDADADEPDADADPVEGWSCAPELQLDETRYTHLENTTDQTLIDGLFLLVDDHTYYSYSGARDFMYAPVDGIDTQLDGYIHCPYTGRLATARQPSADDFRTPDGFNTEHSWPKSDSSDTPPHVSDIHHLFPTWMASNSARASHEFGNTNCSSNCSWQEGGSKLGPSEDGRSTVFEVRPESRGDIARAHFYFSVRYGLPIPQLEEAVLRDWHCEDPPDDWERLRNDRIEVVQENRNPFIDRPDFVDQIADF